MKQLSRVARLVFHRFSEFLVNQLNKSQSEPIQFVIANVTSTCLLQVLFVLFPKQVEKVGPYMHCKPLTKWDENPSRTGWNHVKPVSLWPDWSLKHREIREWTIQNVVVESTKIGLLTLVFMGFILVVAAVYAHRFRWESNACVSVLLPSLRGSAHYGWMEKTDFTTQQFSPVATEDIRRFYS
jgi:hypothetical protein